MLQDLVKRGVTVFYVTGFGIAWGNSAAGVTGTTFFATTGKKR